MKEIGLLAALYTFCFVSVANADYADGCKELLNSKVDGKYVFWKNSSTLFDEAKSDAAIGDYYLSKFVEEKKTNPSFDLNKRCEEEVGFLTTLSSKSKSSFFVGSSSGVCLKYLSSKCPELWLPAQQGDLTEANLAGIKIEAVGGTAKISDQSLSRINGKTVIKIDIKGEAQAPVIPRVMSVVLDLSGSMDRNNRIGIAKETLRTLLDYLSELPAQSMQYFALTTFTDIAEKAITPTIVTKENKAALLARIDRLYAGGENLVKLGFEYGVEQLGDMGGIVFLLTDGIEQGLSAEPLRQFLLKKNKGNSCIAFGLGNGVNEDLLTALTKNNTGIFLPVLESGSGEEAELKRKNELKNNFQLLLASAASTVATAITVTAVVKKGGILEVFPDVNHTISNDKKSVTLIIPTVAAGQTKTVYLALTEPSEVRLQINSAQNAKSGGKDAVISLADTAAVAIEAKEIDNLLESERLRLMVQRLKFAVSRGMSLDVNTLMGGLQLSDALQKDVQTLAARETNAKDLLTKLQALSACHSAQLAVAEFPSTNKFMGSAEKSLYERILEMVQKHSEVSDSTFKKQGNVADELKKKLELKKKKEQERKQ